MSGELIFYTSKDSKTRLDLRIEERTVWLTQLEIADLFQTTKHNVSIHTKNIFEDGELAREATVKESLTVQTEGTRKVRRTIQLYNLDLILAIGYRVRIAISKRNGEGKASSPFHLPDQQRLRKTV